VKRVVEVAGRALAAEVREGQGPTVVFDAGLGGWSLYWRPVMDVLPGRAMAAWDRPGLGGSDADASLRSAEQVARRWREALRALGLAAPYVLVGHSLGGHHVRAFASAWPDEVVGVVLVDVSVARRPTGRVRQAITVAAARRRDPQAGAARLLERFSDEDRLQALQLMGSEHYREAVAHELSCVDERAEALSRPLPDVPVSVLSGSGTELDQLPVLLRRAFRLDRVIARIQTAHRAVAASVPQADWVVVPGSSHHIPLDDPQAVAAAIDWVLTREPVAP
jgi:pimeloyl-ACP methyl ester carboxylesterase